MSGKARIVTRLSTLWGSSGRLDCGARPCHVLDTISVQRNRDCAVHNAPIYLAPPLAPLATFKQPFVWVAAAALMAVGSVPQYCFLMFCA